MLLKTIKNIYLGIQYLIYPPFCFHCSQMLNKNSCYLCDPCIKEFKPLDKLNRCKHCYSEKEDQEDSFCYKCIKHHKIFKGTASVFDYNGPAGSIIKKMKYENMPFLNQGIGSFMTLCFLQQNWELPDLIIPVPASFSHKLQRGYNQSLLLAKVIGEQLNVSISDCLIRKKNGISQAGLLNHQREKLSIDLFSIKSKNTLQNKTILLIDDVYTTGKTLKNCAEVITQYSPKDIFALTFCKSEE